jgi:hypothetical protein
LVSVADRLNPVALTVALAVTSARLRTSALLTATAAPMLAVLAAEASPVAMA